MLLEVVLEFKESSVPTLLNKSGNADISKGPMFLTVQPTRCDVTQFIYFCRTLYRRFQTGFPSIMRSSKLYVTYSVRYWSDAVCAVLSSSWWTENPSETCRASYRNKQIVKLASCWLYCENILAMHRPVNVKSRIFRSLSLKPANYRAFKKGVTVSFLKCYVIRNVRTAKIDTSSKLFITPHRLCLCFCSVGVHVCKVHYISLYAKHTKEITCDNCGINMQSVKHCKYSTNYKSYCSTVHFRRIISIYQPKNAHIISHKTP